MPPDTNISRPSQTTEEVHSRCHSCEEQTIIHHTDRPSGEEFCEPCTQEYFVSCESCGLVTDLETIHYGDDEPYCEACYVEGHTSCESCGEFSNNDYIVWRNDYAYCESCVPDEEEDMIYNLENNSPPSVSRKSETFTYPVRRLVGIEAECVFPSDYDLYTPKYWSTVSDGSISTEDGESGIELVGYPANGDLLENSVDRLMTWSEEHNAHINRSCGLHIHFNSLDLSAREVAHIGIVYSHFEEVLKGMMPKSRQKSNWCRDFPIPTKELRSVDTENSLLYMYYDYMDSYPSSDKYNDARYCGLNIHSRYYHGSIEFRLHSGTLNKTKILNWIMILDVIILKGIELSKADEDVYNAWIETSPTRQMMSTFGEGLCSYINKRTRKFKKERENE